MCLAVPGKIVSLDEGAQATINVMGVTRDISVRLTPEAQVDDYVLVHAGFAIQVIDAEEAAEAIRILRELDELSEEELSAEGA